MRDSADLRRDIGNAATSATAAHNRQHGDIDNTTIGDTAI